MEEALRLGLNILYIIMLFGGLLYIPRLVFMLYGFKKQKELPNAEIKNKYSILIPARNEFRVIETLLKSIRDQTYPKTLIDTYVMVTSEDDPTCEICKKYNVKKVIVVPPDLNSKGKTLDICLKEILQENAEEYSAHFIIDADNVLSPTFIEKMNNVYAKGYKLAMGRRTNKSADGFISNSSFLTFTYVNTLNNKFRTRLGGSITISGSGFYVDNELIKMWGGWPFHSITEDYELSKWAVINDEKVYYCECATVADEQPTKMSQSKIQRFRWIKGHNVVDSKENGKLFKSIITPRAKNKFLKIDYLFSLFPVFFTILGLASFFVYSLGCCVVALCMGSALWIKALLYALNTIGIVYTLLLGYTLLGLIADREVLNLGFWRWVGLFFGFPFFLITWVPLYFKSFFVKKIEWEPIEHKINIEEDKKDEEEIIETVETT